MIKICFIVLHYNSIKDTEKCVKSIIRNYIKKNHEINILILDNNSPNGTGKTLYEKYNNLKGCKVILNTENSGFSRGNNIAYLHLDCKYDFVIFANNDLIFKQKKFIEQIEKIYSQYDFAVLCPDVLAYKRHEHQSPIVLERLNLGDTDISIEQDKKRYEAYKEGKIPNEKYYKEHYFYATHPFRKFLHEKYNAIFWMARDLLYPCKKYSEPHEAVMPIGACLIFSQKYFEKYKLPFWPETFFYNEESILAYNCEKAGLKLLYHPSLRVNHTDKGATSTSFENYIKAHEFEYKNMVDSLKIYRKLITNEMDDILTEEEIMNIINEKIN